MKTVITFKAKPETACVHSTALCELEGWHITDNALKVPSLTRKHVTQANKRLRQSINSDMADGVIRHQVRAKYGKALSYIDADNPPQGVTVQDTGFLKTVTIELGE